jgi:hypothetical protein
MLDFLCFIWFFVWILQACAWVCTACVAVSVWLCSLLFTRTGFAVACILVLLGLAASHPGLVLGFGVALLAVCVLVKACSKTEPPEEPQETTYHRRCQTQMTTWKRMGALEEKVREYERKANESERKNRAHEQARDQGFEAWMSWQNGLASEAVPEDAGNGPARAEVLEDSGTQNDPARAEVLEDSVGTRQAKARPDTGGFPKEKGSNARLWLILVEILALLTLVYTFPYLFLALGTICLVLFFCKKAGRNCDSEWNSVPLGDPVGTRRDCQVWNEVPSETGEEIPPNLDDLLEKKLAEEEKERMHKSEVEERKRAGFEKLRARKARTIGS